METAARPASNDLSELQKNAALIGETAKLNHLTRIAIDANKLYGEAAAEADDAELKSELQVLSADNGKFAQDLQTRVAALGGEPAETGEAAGTVHRSFAAIHALIQNDSIAAAKEVYRGETYLIDELGKTLERSLTPVSKDLVEAQLSDAREGRNRVEAMQARIETRLKAEDAAENRNPG